jgi:hypothetical protein
MFLEDHALHKTLAESPAGTPTQLTLAELAHIHTLAYMLETYIINWLVQGSHTGCVWVVDLLWSFIIVCKYCTSMSPGLLLSFENLAISS